MLALPFLETSLDFGSMSGCDAALGQRTSPLGPGCEGRCLREVPAVPLACGNQPCPRADVFVKCLLWRPVCGSRDFCFSQINTSM